MRWNMRPSSFADEVHVRVPGHSIPNMTFPSFPPGESQEDIERELEQLRAGDSDVRATFGDRWLNDRGLLLDDGALQVAKKASDTLFTNNNSSSVIQPLESELVAWVLNLFHGGPGAAGVLPSGGSESLFLAPFGQELGREIVDFDFRYPG